MNATSVVMREWRRAQTAQAARANQAEALRQERDAAQLDATQARERAAELAGELAQARAEVFLQFLDGARQRRLLDEGNAMYDK